MIAEGGDHLGPRVAGCKHPGVLFDRQQVDAALRQRVAGLRSRSFGQADAEDDRRAQGLGLIEPARQRGIGDGGVRQVDHPRMRALAGAILRRAHRFAGAQPLAAVMAGACCLAVECDETRADFRIRTRYCDEKTHSLDEALAMIDRWTKAGEAKSVALIANAADVFPELVRRMQAGEPLPNGRPDIVTDQTSAHDPVHGYLPKGWSVAEWREKQESDPKAVTKAAKASMREHVAAMVDFWNAGVPTLDYGNNIRQMALEEGLEDAFAFPGFVPAYIRPLFCRGVGPFRWAALSGDPEDIYKTDQKVKELIDDPHLHNWLDMARERISFQGLPARICWVGLKDRARLGQAFNEMVKSGELKAPIVIGRDHLDSGSVASPNRETEAMMDGSDAVSDWPLLNALLNTAGGATWVSLHHGGGVGMGYSQHSGVVIVCDGSDDAHARIGRVLRNDPGTGVMRHADAGYDIAKQCAQENGLDLPMVNP